MDSKRIELCVPAERSMLLVIRMTTSGVMSRAGLTLDEVDDVKMAIDEACNLMMLQKTGCQQLAVSYEYNDGCVCVKVEGKSMIEAAAVEQSTDSSMQDVIRCILESMMDEVEMTAREDGSTEKVCMKKKLPEDRRPSV